MIDRDTSPGFIHTPLDMDRIEALKRLLNVAERGAQAMLRWPTFGCDTPERDYKNSLEESYESLSLAMATIAEAINDLTVSYRPPTITGDE